MPHHTKGLAQFHLFGMKYIRQEAHNFLYIKVLKIIYKWNILKFIKDLWHALLLARFQRAQMAISHAGADVINFFD